MKKFLKVAAVTVFWLTIWYLAVIIFSLVKNMDLSYNPLFPYPHDVIKSLFKLFLTGSYYVATLASLLRIVIAIIIAVILGVITAVACSRINFLHLFIKPVLATIKSVPVTVFVFILYLILFKLTSIFITILMVYPIVFSNVYEGIKNVDKDLLDVCRVYKIPFRKRIKSLYLPTVMPYFISALTTGIGLAWKAGVAAEALCPPTRSMGMHISMANQTINNEELFAWALTLVIINIVFELVFKRIINLAFRKWLPSEVKK